MSKRPFSIVAVVVFLVLAMLPALAEHVPPEFVSGNFSCSNVDSDGPLQLTIVDPVVDDTYTGPDGTQIVLTNTTRRQFDFSTDGAVVFDLIVKGSGANWYDYDGDGDGPVRSDENLEIPNGNKLNVVHFCYSGNSAPVAVDDAISGNEDTVITGNVLTNDTDADGDSLTAIKVSDPSNGTLTTLTSAGAVSYTPDDDFNGTDSFTYKANDGFTDSNVVTVTITVSPVNDPPVAVDDPNYQTAGGFIDIDVLANDTDIDSSDLFVAQLQTTTDQGGTTEVVEVLGEDLVRYTPPSGFSGVDTFTYKANDGSLDSADPATVTVTVFGGDIGCGGIEILGDGSFVTERGDDFGGTVECKGADGQLLYTFEQGQADEGDPFALFVDFIATNTNPQEGDGTATFIETITWDLDAPAPGDPQFAPLYYDDHVDADGPRLMPWCATDLWDEANDEAFFPGTEDSPIPDGHTSCLIHTETFTSANGVTSTDTVYTEVDGFRAK
jgi:hypothetical protein